MAVGGKGAEGGREVRMGDDVSHELEKQPKAAFAPFLKFFTTSFDALSLLRCSAGERSRKTTGGKGNFPLPSPPFRYLFLRSRGMCSTRSRVSVSGRRLSDRLRFYFPAYRAVTRALVFAIVLTFAKCKSHHDSIKCSRFTLVFY